MRITITESTSEAIQPLRALFLHEGNFQFIRNSYHARKWADVFVISVNEQTVGYGALCGMDDRNVRDTIFEFYILPPYRKMATQLFRELVRASGATAISCQSNDSLLASLLYVFSENINTEAILFEENITTELTCADVVFRPKNETDKIFEHKAEPEGSYVLELNGEVVATGGFLLHYNPPYADLYMEVKEDCRRKGYGSFIIQELKKACYFAGRVPAARCGVDNTGSRLTLIKAGMKVCGYWLMGKIAK